MRCLGELRRRRGGRGRRLRVLGDDRPGHAGRASQTNGYEPGAPKRQLPVHPRPVGKCGRGGTGVTSAWWKFTRSGYLNVAVSLPSRNAGHSGEATGPAAVAAGPVLTV